MNEQITIRSSDQDLVTISVSEEQIAELDSIARDAGSRFINVVDGGFKFQERTIRPHKNELPNNPSDEDRTKDERH